MYYHPINLLCGRTKRSLHRRSHKYSTKICIASGRIDSNVGWNKLLQLAVSPNRRKSSYHSFGEALRSRLSNGTVLSMLRYLAKRSSLKRASSRRGFIPSPFSVRTENRVSSIPSIPRLPRMRIKSRRGSPIAGGRPADTSTLFLNKKQHQVVANEGRITRKRRGNARGGTVMEFGRYPEENKDVARLFRLNGGGLCRCRLLQDARHRWSARCRGRINQDCVVVFPG